MGLLMRRVEVVAGFTTALLAIPFIVDALLDYVEMQARPDGVGAASQDISIIMFLIIPALFISIGTYLQAIRRDRLGIPLLFLGLIINLPVYSAGFYLMFSVGPNWKPLVYLALISASFVTFVAALGNTVLNDEDESKLEGVT